MSGCSAEMAEGSDICLLCGYKLTPSGGAGSYYPYAGGFGLQLVGMMAQQLQGKIKIERGRGTKFFLEFNSPGPKTLS